MWKWEAEGRAKAVVGILHSAYEHHSRYAWVTQQLRSQQYHVIMGDLPGHGIENHVHNDLVETYTNYVKKLIEVCEHENLPYFIIGHGFGATLLLRLLQKEKIECAGIIITSPWLSLQHQPPKISSVLNKLNPSAKVDHSIDPRLLTKSDDRIKEFEADEKYSAVITPAWYNDIQLLMRTIEQSPKAMQNVPTLFMLGSHDRVTNIDYAKLWIAHQHLDELQFKVWKNCYHDLLQEPERRQIALYMDAFMNNVLRSIGYIV